MIICKLPLLKLTKVSTNPCVLFKTEKKEKKIIKYLQKPLDIKGFLIYHNQACLLVRLFCDEVGDCGLAGNFHGVCPTIGRPERSCMLRISFRIVFGRQIVPAINLPKSDTHGIAYKLSRPYAADFNSSIPLRTNLGGKNNYGNQQRNDPYPSESL